MGRVIAVGAVVAFLGLYAWFLQTQSRGRWLSALWVAFSTSMVAALYLVAGFAGYTLSRHDRFVTGSAWGSTVIWWQVGVGLGALGLAVLCWRKGLQSLRSSRS